VRAAERSAGLGEALSTAVARAYHKLLAAKDEWEVARLFAAPEFQTALANEFEGDYRLHFHIGAWPFARLDPASGRMKKGELGPWAMTAFRVMARLKFLRGTWLDPFRNSDERKLERRLIAEFEADVANLTERLTPASHAIAVRVVGAYETIRGYGHVKEAGAAEAAKTRADALNELKGGKALVEKAA
jgi:indolepyruvate ferredoxin oxidoreductase